MAKKSKIEQGSNEEDVRWRIYTDTKKRIKKRYDRRAEVVSHAVAYGIGMIVIIIAIFFAEWISGWLATLALVSAVGWTMGFFIHLSQHMMYELSEHALNQELDRLGLFNVNEKAKRDGNTPPQRLVRLSDDGEIIDLYDADMPDEMGSSY